MAAASAAATSNDNAARSESYVKMKKRQA